MQMQIRYVCTLCSLALAAILCSAQQPGQAVAEGARYGQLPLTFEENHGQTDPRVQFLSRAKGYTAFLNAGGIVLSLRPAQSTKADVAPNSSPAQNRRPSNTALEFRLVGAASNVMATGEDLQPGRVNYFLGNDRAKWHTNVPTYRRVRYKNLYPGIDLIYYGNHRELEYDFAIAPHADPGSIEFEVRGARQIELGSDGNLIVTMSGGQLQFESPHVYQESNGLHVPLQGEYVIKSSNRVGFHVANFDRSKSLVIDPVLVYSTYLGGSGDDQPTGIAVDGNGSVYVTGSTDSTDLPLATLGSLPPGADHVFVAKFDASGSNLVYCDYIGGNSQDYGFALALDSANQVYVTGSTASSNFPLVNAYQSTYPGSFNAFLTKISADGSSLLYSTYLGGNGSDVPSRVAVDNLSDILVAGTTSSTNFPVANAYQSAASSNQGGLYGNYGFITKFTPDGSSLVYSTYFAGSSNMPDNCGGTQCWTAPATTLAGMAIDSAGNAYVAGTTNTYDFPATEGAYLAANSTQDNSPVGFVSKIDGSGNLQYSTYFYESSGFTIINAIAVDGSGSAYVTGVTYSDGAFPITSTSICDPGVYGAACSYAFVTKFDAAAATLVYSTFLGPNNNAIPVGIALDQNSDAFILSSTSSSSFGIVNGIEPYGGGQDALLVEVDPAAGSQLFATYLGGSSNETAAGIALDSQGNLYLTGTTDSTDFPITPLAFQPQPGGNGDGFVMKIGPASAPSVSFTPGALTYPSQQVGSSSSAQQVTLRNLGSAGLSITSISAVGDFSETDTCGNMVPASGNCTISVTFTPSAGGLRTGSITIGDNAAGSPHVISLTGTGLSITPVVVLSPASLAFSSVPVGGSSASQSITLSNQGSSTLSISNIQVTGDFSQTNSCPSTLAANSTCTVSVTFTPTVSGNRTGTLSISDNGTGSPQSVALSGTGSDFAVADSTTSATVKAGATASYTLTVTPVGGTFGSPIQLSCSGAPAASTCSLSPSSVTPGSNPATATLSIATTASSAMTMPLMPGPQTPAYAFWIQVSGFGLFAMTVISSRRRKKGLAVFLLLGSCILFMPACAGGTGIISPGGKGTAPGTYTITVTGTSGGLQHSAPLTLVVQ